MGFLQMRQAGATLSLQCAGLSLSWPLLLHSIGSRAQAQLLRGMWDPPRPGLEPVSPALAGRFLTTAPPGKPSHNLITEKTTINIFEDTFFSIGKNYYIYIIIIYVDASYGPSFTQ